MNAEEEMAAWRNWKDLCALALISNTERIQLQQVISDRFRSMVRKVNLHGRGALTAPPNPDCAHLFESYCAMHQRRDGKKYKQWLLSRGRQDLDTVQSGVMLLIRNVVREWVRDSHPQTAEVSLQHFLGQGATPVTLEELLPDTKSETRTAEQSEWIEETIRNEVESLEAVERAVLLIRARGSVFSAAGIREEFGFGKTALHKYHRLLLERWAAEARDLFPELAPAEGAGLVLDLMDGMGKKLFRQSFAENNDFSAFGEMEVCDDAE